MSGKIKLFRYNTISSRDNPSWPYTPSNPAKPVPCWSGPPKEINLMHSYVVAHNHDTATKFCIQRALGEMLNQDPAYSKPMRLYKGKLASTYLLSGKMLSQIERNAHVNHDWGNSSASLKEIGLQLCYMAMEQNLKTAYELFAPGGIYECACIRYCFTRTLVDKIVELEKNIPGVTPEYAMAYAIANP